MLSSTMGGTFLSVWFTAVSLVSKAMSAHDRVSKSLLDELVKQNPLLLFPEIQKKKRLEVSYDC